MEKNQQLQRGMGREREPGALMFGDAQHRSRPSQGMVMDEPLMGPKLPGPQAAGSPVSQLLRAGVLVKSGKIWEMPELAEH